MSGGRRASLPGAEELFRVTALAPEPDPASPIVDKSETGALAAHSHGEKPTHRRFGVGASGREFHEEKVTFYCTPEELTELEQGRIRLRAEHGIGVDRGRLVRVAIALALAEMEEHGPESGLVRRLAATRRR
ncbi:MAG: hypothetical protein WDA71_06375 [Actinomycetota bacterium]